MAELLRDKGFRAHTTTIHKIENDQRPVPVDEASAIADIFGISLDKLLGRDAGIDRDLFYTLNAASQTALQAAPVISSLEASFSQLIDQISAFEFDERDELVTAWTNLSVHLSLAVELLAKATTPLRAALLPYAADEVQVCDEA
jgi:transcriptional regulator with XRE-family HTH domain